MKGLQLDPKSGFLEANYRHTLTAELKLELLSMAQEYVDRGEYPDLNFICRKLGFNVRTFWRHYDADETFRDEYNEIDFQIENILNRNLIANAKKANGVGAAAFWLKNRISKRWSDDPRGNMISVDVSSLKRAVEASKSFIDGEIVENPKQ